MSWLDAFILDVLQYTQYLLAPDASDMLALGHHPHMASFPLPPPPTAGGLAIT